MVGGGQLARMTRRPRSSSASACACWPSGRTTARAQVVADVEVGDYRVAGRPAGLRRGLRRGDLRPRARARRAPRRAGGRRGRRAARPGGARASPRTSWPCGERLDRARRAVPALGAGRSTWPTLRGVRRRGGWPVVLKAPRGGYDGKGVLGRASRRPRPPDWCRDRHAAAGRGARADFAPRAGRAGRARSPSGQGAAWPVVETVQRDGICRRGDRAGARPGRRAGASTRSDSRCGSPSELGVTGVLAVELFETDGRRMLVNELAMRPHNTGHWTIDGAAHVAVRAAPARGARPAARRHRR